MGQSELMKQLSANLPCPVCGTPLISLGSALDAEPGFGPRTKWPAITIWTCGAIVFVLTLSKGEWLFALWAALLPLTWSWGVSRARKKSASRPVVCTGCSNYFDARDLT